MTTTEAIQILTNYQFWRRGEIETLDYSPKEIGEAIDVILDYVRTTKY